MGFGLTGWFERTGYTRSAASWDLRNTFVLLSRPSHGDTTFLKHKLSCQKPIETSYLKKSKSRISPNYKERHRTWLFLFYFLKIKSIPKLNPSFKKKSKKLLKRDDLRRSESCVYTHRLKQKKGLKGTKTIIPISLQADPKNRYPIRKGKQKRSTQIDSLTAKWFQPMYYL